MVPACVDPGVGRIEYCQQPSPSCSLSNRSSAKWMVVDRASTSVPAGMVQEFASSSM